MAYDLITMGRIGVDLYPLQTGVPLPQVTSFGKFLGGSATNVAVAASRLGRSTAVITRTGEDPFGDYLHQALRDFGVDDRWVTPVPGLATPITFCEVFPPDDFPLYFYRRPKAPDLEIDAHELDLDAIAGTRIFWVTGTGLSEEPSRTATLESWRRNIRSRETPGAPASILATRDWLDLSLAASCFCDRSRPVRSRRTARPTANRRSTRRRSSSVRPRKSPASPTRNPAASSASRFA